MIDENAIWNTMSTAERAAARWWKHHRPVNWTLEQHLAEWHVNCNVHFDLTLAAAVSGMYKKRIRQLKKTCTPKTSDVNVTHD